jgi:uncharacterized protein (TIGR03067 family)
MLPATEFPSMLIYPLVLTLSVGLAADKDLEPLQGVWQAQRIVGKGKELPAENVKRISFAVENNTMRRFVNDIDRKDPGTIKVDPSKKPPHIDLTTGKQGDPPMFGIYEIDGDTLKWCFGRKRPEKFESAEGSDATLIIMKRVKK